MDFIKKAASSLARSFMPEGDRPPISSASDQPQDEQDLVAYIRNQVEQSRNSAARVAFEQIALTNTAYLMGYDSVQFNTNLRQFLPVAWLTGSGYSGGKSKAHTNLILPNVQNRLARLLKNPPKYDVMPEVDSVDGKDAAELSLKVINNIWDKERIDEKRIELGMWMQQAGHAWMKVSWNATKGKPLPFQQQEMDDLASAITSPEPVNDEIHFEGDIDVDVCSPFEIFVDPLAKNQDEMTWLIHAKVRKISYFRDHYKERGHLVKSEGAWLLSIQNLFKINNMNTRGSTGSNDDKSMENAAIELAYFEKPTRKYPRGRMIITANGILLKYDELPIGEIPYTKFDDVKIGGKFYSESLITHLRPIQDQYNRSQARKAEMVNKGLALKIMAGKGHGFTQESMNDNTEILEYNHVESTSEPKQLKPPEIPSFVFTEDQNLKGNFAEIAGISEPSKGQIPSASIPGVGLQLLIESDDTRIGIVTTSNENSWAQVGRHIAKYAATYYKTTRYLKEAGEDGEYSFTEFTGDDLRDSFDVRVKKGSTLPNSKVLKRQETVNLFDKGLLGDPADPMTRFHTLKDLDYGDVGGAWEDLRVNMQQINRTIKAIEQGQIPIVSPDDNHELHYDFKNRLRKTIKYEMYQPQIKAVFDQNLAEHKMYIAYPQLKVPPPPMPPQQPGVPGNGQGLMQEPPMDQNFQPTLEQYPTDELPPQESPMDPGLLDMNANGFN